MRWLRQKSGQALVTTTLFMGGILGMAALAIDGGNLYMARASLQRVADAAVLAGASGLAVSQSEATVRANNIAALNLASQPSLAGSLTTVSFPSPTTIQVTVSNPAVGLFLGGVVGIPFAAVSANASISLAPVASVTGDVVPLAIYCNNPGSGCEGILTVGETRTSRRYCGNFFDGGDGEDDDDSSDDTDSDDDTDDDDDPSGETEASSSETETSGGDTETSSETETSETESADDTETGSETESGGETESPDDTDDDDDPSGETGEVAESDESAEDASDDACGNPIGPGEVFLQGITITQDSNSNSVFRSQVYNGYPGTVSLGDEVGALPGNRNGWRDGMTDRLAEGRDEMTLAVIRPVGEGPTMEVVDFVKIRVTGFTPMGNTDSLSYEIIQHVTSSGATAGEDEGLGINSVVKAQLTE
ncbi:MAG: pilus assembly protein TadG-related protein [Nitrospinota bacterium]